MSQSPIMPSWDVFTLGETMIRFTPKGFTRLEEASELEMRIGGSESNVAIALARLGLSVAWASRLPRNPLGELTARRIRSFGVDVSQVSWAEGGRMGLYFIEPGAAPRTSLVLYDRAGSAASEMSPEDFDWSALDRARHVHLTGITPALSASARETTATAIREARGRGRTVSFDVNYRARLWSCGECRGALLPLVRDVDLLISTLADALQVFGLEGSPEAVAAGLGEITGAGLIALTLGAEGALLWDRAEYYRVEPHPVHAVDRVGAGDAFDAGLLWGFLQGEPRRGLRYGMAMAAIKHTIPGDEFISSLEEIEALLDAGHRDIQR
ncbi:MAG TPA: sugar kinase [Armatimonadota bacterium]|nr:sugar kinase [Armatimonadota bacterium]